ncbi:hypothetical protein ABEB36_015845 [Hypothenemus hampei]|uniref:Uncharacterized protein n=1 Tax=Hypothenemus hampei TaxID=57062 RepID=A0ABD1DYW2_HYPHA
MSCNSVNSFTEQGPGTPVPVDEVVMAQATLDRQPATAAKSAPAADPRSAGSVEASGCNAEVGGDQEEEWSREEKVISEEEFTTQWAEEFAIERLRRGYDYESPEPEKDKENASDPIGDDGWDPKKLIRTRDRRLSSQAEEEAAERFISDFGEAGLRVVERQKILPKGKGSSADTVSSEAESFLTGLATSGRARRRRKAKRKISKRTREDTPPREELEGGAEVTPQEVRTKRYRSTTDEDNLWEAEAFLRRLCQQVEVLDREMADAYRPKKELKEAAKEIVKIVEGLTMGDLGKGLQLALNARAAKRLATTSEGQATVGEMEVAVGRLQEEDRAMRSERDGLIEERRGMQQEMAILRKKNRDLELGMGSYKGKQRPEVEDGEDEQGT